MRHAATIVQSSQPCRGLSCQKRQRRQAIASHRASFPGSDEAGEDRKRLEKLERLGRAGSSQSLAGLLQACRCRSAARGDTLCGA